MRPITWNAMVCDGFVVRGEKGLRATEVSLEKVLLVQPVPFVYICGYQRGKWERLGKTAPAVARK
jgi:hypothetical protein